MVDSCAFAQTATNGDLTWAPKCKAFKLRNYQTNETVEVAGPQSNGYHDCRHNVCTSTFASIAPHAHQNMLANEKIIDEFDLKSPDYVKKEADEFLSIYHKDNQTPDSEYEQRLKDIDSEIKKTGTYKQTIKEITYGAQLAWRNSARCINRLYWRKLEIVDARHVQTNDQMFEEICKYIRFAYNNGALKASALIFDPKSRCWSPQYFRYACYEQSDGSLLGDPANQELTRIAMRLGWNKPEDKRTQWDVLPIIVQVEPNTAPSWYELPEDLCRQIILSHPDPKYDAPIKSLGIRWFAQRFASNKVFEIGGLFYRCVSFSGWFVETELGRHLCDSSRYNFLPKLAALLNVDISTGANSQLNIDRLYLEIHAAILHSFEQAKVAMVDHHTVTKGFMTFFKADIKARGNTPCDRLWLVPPISSVLTPVYHQEMVNYIVKPRILNQLNPWINYKPFVKEDNTNKLPLKVKAHQGWFILRAARVVIGFALAAMKQRILVNVLYASSSGTALNYAQQLTKRLRSIGYNPVMMELDAYKFEEHDNDEIRSIVLIVTSTFGQGNAPDGGTKVEEWLKKENNETNTSINPQSVKGKRGPLMWYSYAVCAVGSSAYTYFCGFGKLIDTKFQSLGGKRLAPIATCDQLNQPDKTYQTWEENIVQILRASYPHSSLRPDKKDESSTDDKSKPTYIPLEFYSETRKTIDQSDPNKPFTKDNPFAALVLQNMELIGEKNSISSTFVQTEADNNVNNDRETNEQHSVRLIVFETPNLQYQPGDHVCIFPQNSPAEVNKIILSCKWKIDDERLDQPCSLLSFTNGKYETLREILLNFVDLSASPRPHFFSALATYASDKKQQREITELSKGRQLYQDWLANTPTTSETLKQFSSANIPLGELIQILPKLVPRYYSISSSNRLNPGQLHITVSVVTYKTTRGIQREGLCSNYLKRTIPVVPEEEDERILEEKATKVQLFVIPNVHFRLPTNNPSDHAILMFAIGSGLAPFRSFWQELQTFQCSKTNNEVKRVLFMGCRTPDDFLHAEELQTLMTTTEENEQIFTDIIPVFSRGNNGAKRYIQHAMLDYEQLIYSMITKDNSFIYMCGSTRACQSIESALASILETSSQDKRSTKEANDYVQKLKQTGVIKQDMFG